MASITVKNIPADLYDRLRQSAKANRRSINSEIIVCIDRAIRAQEFDLDATISAARRLRQRTAHYLITDEEFNQAKAEGRP